MCSDGMKSSVGCSEEFVKFRMSGTSCARLTCSRTSNTLDAACGSPRDRIALFTPRLRRNNRSINLHATFLPTEQYLPIDRFDDRFDASSSCSAIVQRSSRSSWMLSSRKRHSRKRTRSDPSVTVSSFFLSCSISKIMLPNW